MEYIFDKDKSLFSVTFDSNVIDHLNAKVDDYLFCLQSIHKYNYFMLFKADTGYRIRRVPNRKKVYQINMGFRPNFIREFDSMDCIYFKKKNGMIRIIIDQ